MKSIVFIMLTKVNFVRCSRYSFKIHKLIPSVLFQFRTCNYSSTSTSAVTSSFIKDSAQLKSAYDVVIIGGGHNGLISAAYLQKAGLSVCVLEKRHVIGGAAVTEEIVPGFKFSRASYVLSLLRPFIIKDLKLKEHGLKFYYREPYSSYTPINEKLWSKYPAKSFFLSNHLNLTKAQIAKFSKKDVVAYEKYEQQMERFIKPIVHLLESRPANLGQAGAFLGAGVSTRLKSMIPLLKALGGLKAADIPGFYEIMTSSAAKILDRWFESEPLKATLATDALIGVMAGPHCLGTGYVLLHHIMGGIEGHPGEWVFAEGGMGGVSQAIGKSAAQLGASIFTEQEIKEIVFKGNRATGVVTNGGKEITANLAVFSNATPEITFKKLSDPQSGVKNFGEEFMRAIDAIDYTSPVTKINVAVSRLPNFTADPCPVPNKPHDPHRGTIHLNCESIKNLEKSFQDCRKLNKPSEKPMIEFVIPSSMDPTISPEGAHVCLFFTQFTPYSPSNGSWKDPEFKEKYAQTVFNCMEEYAPGFKESIIGKEILTPVDLESEFGLTGGNIFHGAMSTDQLYWLRPIFTDKCWFPQTPAQGLYLCGSGAHPGGGVMGLPGYLAAKALIESK